MLDVYRGEVINKINEHLDKKIQAYLPRFVYYTSFKILPVEEAACKSIIETEITIKLARAITVKVFVDVWDYKAKYGGATYLDSKFDEAFKILQDALNKMLVTYSKILTEYKIL